MPDSSAGKRTKNREGEDELSIFCNGSYIEIDGQRVLAPKRMITRCELDCRGQGKEVYASEPEALLENK
jgi:hypothetical protein